MGEPTPNSEATKTMLALTSFPEEPTPAKSVPGEEHGRASIRKYMICMAWNQRAIFKKIQRMECKSIHLYHHINGPLAGDCSFPPTPLSSNANSIVHATPVDSTNAQAESDPIQIVEEVLKDLGTSAKLNTRRLKRKVE
ncbi:hypothetical protein V6N11_021777 [Hibiscus sabdariffa]|uniref:Uncharacterized protein n=1 Tax=Hibiscus sabdariffa TaxID=183260 RepID=A0ABR2TH90_9ROSI